MYRCYPYRYLADIFRFAGQGLKKGLAGWREGECYAGRIERLCKLGAPIFLSDLRNHKVLRTAWFVRRNMQGIGRLEPKDDLCRESGVRRIYAAGSVHLPGLRRRAVRTDFKALGGAWYWFPRGARRPVPRKLSPLFANCTGTPCMGLSGIADIRRKMRRTWFKAFSFT